MKVKIYFQDGAESKTYDLSLQEFQRLAQDYEKYLKEGTPKAGMYDQYINAESRQQQTLFLDFKTISSIG